MRLIVDQIRVVQCLSPSSLSTTISKVFKNPMYLCSPPHHISACSALGIQNLPPDNSLQLDSPVSMSFLQPTLFAEALFHEEPHHHQDQFTSIQLSKTLDPEFFMKDMESELFHYTTGHFLWVSSTLSCLWPTPNVMYSVRMRTVTSKSIAASSISPVSLKSLLRHGTARPMRSSA